MEIWLNIPTVKIKKVFIDNYNCTYYELYLNDKYEGRYQYMNDIHWRLGLILSEQALLSEV